VVGEGRPVLAVLARRDHRLSKALRLHVPSDVAPGPGDLLGLELEFSVRSEQGRKVNFNSLIHCLALDGATLDPGDPNAYRCSWGGVITSDGAEAEIATPPVWTRPGFTGQLQGWARVGEAELRRAMPRRIELDGYSAHFSASMPEKLNDRVCRLYAETFAADLMLLTSRVDTPGLQVRPRPGRTELCGEFAEGVSLAAAAAFVAGTARACAAAVRSPGARTALPPRLDVRLARAVQRYGWYVDSRALGADRHADPRRALLPRASGGTIRAQSHLEIAWAAARQALADDGVAADLQAADAMVNGSVRLPAENSQSNDAADRQHRGDDRLSVGSCNLPRSPRLCAHVRPGFILSPVAATWDFTVFAARGAGLPAYACIPRDSLQGFLAALEQGALDDAVTAYLALTSRRRVLSAHQQTKRLGLYHTMGAPAELLAPERDPQTGHRVSGERGAKRMLARPGKRLRPDQQAVPGKKARFLSRAAAIGVAIAVVLAAAGAAAAVLSHGPSGPNGPDLQPPSLSFPVVPVGASITRAVTVTNNGSSPATITRISIGGQARHDFSVRSPGLLDAAYRGGLAVRVAMQAPACNRRVPRGQTCIITVVFAPSAPGWRTADLRIHFTAPIRPRDIALSGTGTMGPPPHVSVTGVSPAGGIAKGGTSVTITGSGFTGATGVSFGGTAADFTVVSGTEITATSPPGSGTVDITVATADGGSATSAADQFTYTAPALPQVTGVFPAGGTTAGGTSVTITGTGFTGATGVSFGGMAADFTVVSGTQITATSPPGSGTADITVTTADGTSATSPADQFAYISPPIVTSVSPATGTAKGGTSVTITGTGFTGATGVSFGGTAANFTFVSGTEITATSPRGSCTVDITVTTPDGTSATSPSDTFTYDTCVQ
jgi:hypothetical protein